MTRSRATGVAAIACIAVAGCTPAIYRAPVREPNYYSIDRNGSRSETYSRINQWSSYGTDGLGAQPAIAAAYERAQHARPPTLDVAVYNASLPAGVSIDDGAIKIAEDAPYEAIGRFEIGYWTASAPREADIVDDLRRLASVAHGDTFVVEVRRVDHADDRVQYINGIVLRRRTVPAKVEPTRRAPRPERTYARLVYRSSGTGCSTADEVADEIAAKLGYSPWRASATNELRAELSGSDGSYHATVYVDGATPRQLSGATCMEVTDALVTVLVVQLGGSAMH